MFNNHTHWRLFQFKHLILYIKPLVPTDCSSEICTRNDNFFQDKEEIKKKLEGTGTANWMDWILMKENLHGFESCGFQFENVEGVEWKEWSHENSPRTSLFAALTLWMHI